MSFGEKVWLLIIGMVLSSFVGFILIGLLEFFIGLIFLIGISYTVYKDAKSRGEASALGWAIGTALLLIVILPLYYFRVVRKKPIIGEWKAPVLTKVCPNCRGTWHLIQVT
jgi:riboflavin transporter FmnP